MDANDRATLEDMLRRARELPGDSLFDSLMRKHQNGKHAAKPPERPHRLLHLTDRIRRVLDASEQGQNAVDLIAFGELHTALGLFDSWPRELVLDNPGDLKAPHGYRHALALRTVAAYLRASGNKVTFVPTKPEEGQRTPDLRIGLDASTVDTEIKAPEALEYPRVPLTPEVATGVIKKALDAARRGGRGGQLASKRNTVLIIGGVGVTPTAIDLLKTAAVSEVERLEVHRSRIVGIGFVSAFVAVTPAGDLHSFFATGFALNSRYEGHVRIGAVSSPSLLPVGAAARFGTTPEILSHVREMNEAA